VAFFDSGGYNLCDKKYKYNNAIMLAFCMDDASRCDIATFTGQMIEYGDMLPLHAFLLFGYLKKIVTSQAFCKLLAEQMPPPQRCYPSSVQMFSPIIRFIFNSYSSYVFPQVAS
jgi:hypothetical protein